MNCITSTSGQKTFFCVNVIFVHHYEHKLGDVYTGSVWDALCPVKVSRTCSSTFTFFLCHVYHSCQTNWARKYRSYLAFVVTSVLLSVSSYCNDILSFRIFPRSLSGSSDRVGYVKKNYKACGPLNLWALICKLIIFGVLWGHLPHSSPSQSHDSPLIHSFASLLCLDKMGVLKKCRVIKNFVVLAGCLKVICGCK